MGRHLHCGFSTLMVKRTYGTAGEQLDFCAVFVPRPCMSDMLLSLRLVLRD